MTGFAFAIAESLAGQPQPQHTKTATCAAVNPVLQLVGEARQLGQVANDRSEAEKNPFLEQARVLQSFSDPDPSQTDFMGRHELLYSVAPRMPHH